MSLLEWAEKVNGDENFLVKKIVGKKLREEVDLGDLIVAREVVQKTFVVGLMEDMEESVRRFNVVLGIDDVGDERNRGCMEEFFGKHEEEEEVRKEEDMSKETNADGDMSLKEDDKLAKANANKFNSHAHPKVWRSRVLSLCRIHCCFSILSFQTQFRLNFSVYSIVSRDFIGIISNPLSKRWKKDHQSGKSSQREITWI